MRVINLGDQEALRSLIRDLRKNNVVEENDGYYHLEVTKENFERLLNDPKFLVVAGYMREEAKQLLRDGKAIMGWYGALITPTWETKHGN